ncbi:MAG: helix-turn-helix transcriptional regulator [Flavonifractor plautii]
MSGYDLQQKLGGADAERWGGVLPGSIYHALKKLEGEGRIALAGVEQTGHRQKAVYRITEAGRSHLHTLIADALRASSALYPTTLYSALSLADKLPPAEVRLALEERAGGGWRRSTPPWSGAAPAMRDRRCRPWPASPLTTWWTSSSGSADAWRSRWRPWGGSMRPGRFGRYAIRTADGVQEAAYLPIGGIKQYIRVRGRSRANPVLLVLHGGPGSTLGATACRWQGRWRRRSPWFIGISGAAGTPITGTQPPRRPLWERRLSDLDELVYALWARYGRDRLFLLGHSWGACWAGSMRSAARRSSRPGSPSARWWTSSGPSRYRRRRPSEGPAGRAGGGRGKAGAGAGAGAGPAAAGPGGGRSPAAVSPRRKERYLPPQYGGPSPLGDWPPRS